MYINIYIAFVDVKLQAINCYYCYRWQYKNNWNN